MLEARTSSLRYTLEQIVEQGHKRGNVVVAIPH